MSAKKFLPAVLAFVLMMLPTIAFAQASKEGVDLRISVNYGHVFYEQHVPEAAIDVDDLSEDFGGIAGSVSIGYRWQYIGLYLEQDLAGLDHDDFCWCTGYQIDKGWHFLGGSYLVVRASPSVTERFELDMGVGAGVMYTTGHDDSNFGTAGAMVPIILDDEGKASVALSFKASIGFTVYFTDIFGMGAHFDYTLGLDKMKYVDDVDGTVVRMNNYIHFLNPGIHFLMRF